MVLGTNNLFIYLAAKIIIVHSGWSISVAVRTAWVDGISLLGFDESLAVPMPLSKIVSAFGAVFDREP